MLQLVLLLLPLRMPVPALFQGAKVRSKQREGHRVPNPALPELEVEEKFLFPWTNEQICFHPFNKFILGMSIVKPLLDVR